MDFYALQLSPKKKKDDKEKREQQIKKFREHVITKEELFADIKPSVEKESDVKSDSQKNVSPDFLSPKSFFLSKSESKIEDESAVESSQVENFSMVKKEGELSGKKKPDEIWNFNDKKNGLREEVLSSKDKEVEKSINVKIKDSDKSKDKSETSSIEKPLINEVEVLAVEKKEIKNESPLKKTAQVVSVDILKVKKEKNQSDGDYKEKISPTLEMGNKKNEEVSDFSNEKIIENFAQAILANDNKKIRIAIEELILFRSKDPIRVNGEFEFNRKLKDRLIETTPALLAYKGGKSVLSLFQLLDQLNIKFTDLDLSKLPDEVLKSQDLKIICEKYLVWFAKEYSDFPAQLQDRIYYFNKCGILLYKEIKGFSALQLAINSDLVDFIRVNVQNPSEVERKIYEFALTGLVDDKEFKKESIVKRIVKKFISTLIVSKKGKPLEVSRKIGEYEEIGLIKANEILEDEKIEKIIEKYLLKFRREHHDHPRKVKALIKDYFDAGLVDKKMRDKLLQN